MTPDALILTSDKLILSGLSADTDTDTVVGCD